MTHTHDEQDVYDRETEFRSEELHLKDVVGSLDERIERGENMGPVHAGTPQAADIAKRVQDTDLERTQSVRDRPYFGRIDFSTGDEGDVYTVYIGDVNLNNENPRYFIASRNAPIAELYYNPAGAYYKEPSGDTNSDVHLKRMLTIDNAQLIDIDDVLRLESGSIERSSLPSRILDQKLSSASRNQLVDIAQTIQSEQYKQIASTTNPVLIVQGAAGSGKSLIGLHRIDFILSPFSNMGSLSRPTAERVIMFGPSTAFLEYVSGLLPGLGVHRIRQTTVNDWLHSKFSSRVTPSRSDKIFEDLINNRRKLSDAEIEAHSFKTGLKMKRLLDSYVLQLKKDIRERPRHSTGMTFPGRPSLELSPSQISGRVANAFRVRPHVNAARTYFVNGLAEEWLSKQPRRDTPRYRAIAEARRLIERNLTFWPRLDFRTEYMNLIQSPDRIMEYSSSGDVDLAGANEISRTAPSGAGRALGTTDLAAALYLDYAINDFNSERLEHIVVDEAQDVSPLEMALMQMHSVNNTFTILGDLRQSILPYKSISNWNQLARLFERESVSRLESRLTYRSTKQITQYANRILQGLPGRTKPPVPYDRSGERPHLVSSKTAKGMRDAIADSVRRLVGLEDVRSVAVLTKWSKTARDISNALRDAGIDGVSRLSTGDSIETDIVVSPIILTKGLEFDAVIVANARKDNFYESDFDRMLFYLACTRARHHLEIHWYGTRSPIVPDVARLPQ